MRGSPEDEAFCCFGLLREREALERIVAMLAEPRRQSVLRVIEGYRGLPDPELRKRLTDLRRAEGEDFRSRWKLPSGVDFDRLNPALRRWLASKTEIDEREDHQG